jgi:hypothetical protein
MKTLPPEIDLLKDMQAQVKDIYVRTEQLLARTEVIKGNLLAIADGQSALLKKDSFSNQGNSPDVHLQRAMWALTSAMNQICHLTGILTARTNQHAGEKFADRYRAGQVTILDLHDFIDEWHDSADDRELHEFLGFSWDEYKTWVETSSIEFLTQRKEAALVGNLKEREKDWYSDPSQST